MYCSCGFTKSADEETATALTETVAAAKKIEVMENFELNPKIRVNCDKCGHTVAYYWTQQTRGADEPETRFFRCVKCRYTWREYS